ncbi:MAG: hypothetical protein LIR50_07500 [Bacillota bacterium]|nr:hypothetical protein [Bacillota bacterium]
MNKTILKKDNEELQQYFHFKKRGFILPNKKGKGSYNRKNFKKVKYDEI